MRMDAWQYKVNKKTTDFSGWMGKSSRIRRLGYEYKRVRGMHTSSYEESNDSRSKTGLVDNRLNSVK